VIIKGLIPLDDASDSEGSAPDNPPVSHVSEEDEFGRIAALTPGRYGRNPVELEFELVEEVKPDPSKANVARRLNLIKAFAARFA
jgi:hypothetical protein